MSDFDQIKLNDDDPRLTAFALDELEGEECARIAAAVAADPSLRAAVEEIRATASRLAIALNGEPLPEPLRPVHIEPYRTVRPARMFRFPYWAVAGLAAAACFAFILALWDGPLFETAPGRDARKLAGAPKEERKGLNVEGAGQHQASNHIDIQFPRQDVAGESQTLSASSGTPEEWGVVVPNPPETVSNAPIPAPAGPGIGAGTEGRLVAQEESHGATPGVEGARARSQLIPAGADDRIAGSDFIAAGQNPRSTFPIHVDTASYARVRRSLLNGRRPLRDAVRIDELVNYFTYDYAAPKPADKARFAASLEAASAPWAPSHRLVRIGLKARELPAGRDSTDHSGAPTIVAREVSVQVEFNPARVHAYRLIGCEDGGRRKEDAGGDRFNAGDVRAGHSVTALYEVVPAGVEWKPEFAAGAPKYQTPAARAPAGDPTARSPGPGGIERMAVNESAPKTGVGDPVAGELLTVTVRYKVPDAGADSSIEFPLVDLGTAFADASNDFRFAAAVAGFGMVLRDSPDAATTKLSDVLQWARQAAGSAQDPRRGEFISLVKRAGEILPAQG